MTLPRLTRRAALLGLAAIAACDVYAVATDPFPGLVQTWNLPATSTSISVASLLPTGVSIYSTPASNPPDSSAFLVNINGVSFSRRIGSYCALCQTLHNTTAAKPAFVIDPDTGSTANLPNNVVRGTLLAGGAVSYTVTNNMSFDPLRVSANLANPQGRLIIVVRSGSVVFARDTVKGEVTPLPAGTSLTRNLAMTSGPVTGSISVDLEMQSPAGDNTFINANGTLGTTANVTAIRVSSADINVPSATLNSGAPEELATDGLDESLRERAIGGKLELTVTNPFAVAGNVDVVFTHGPGQTITKTFAMPSGTTPQVRLVSLDSAEIQNILKGSPTTFMMTGGVSATGAITVTPKQVVSVSNRLVLTLRAFGGK